MPDTTDATGVTGLFGSIINDAFKFATPFAQKLLGTSSTPNQVQAEVLKNAALNGSGPNDPTLANQSPLGILDFITGSKSASNSAGSGLKSSGISSTTILILVAVLAVLFLAIRR